MEDSQPLAPIPHRQFSRPVSGFRPISRTQSSSAHSRIRKDKERGFDSLPLSQLLLSKEFCQNEEDDKKASNEPEKDADEIEGESDFQDADGDDANFQSVFSLDEEKLEKDGFTLQRKKSGVEFSETPPPRFGSSKREKAKRWKEEETEFFFKCLQMCGTDFSMISKFFPERTRKMIVNKFHCEERKGSDKFKEAMSTPLAIDIDKFAEVNRANKADIVDDFARNKERLMSGLPFRRPIPTRDDSDALSGDDDFEDVEDESKTEKRVEETAEPEPVVSNPISTKRDEKDDDEVEGSDDFNFD